MRAGLIISGCAHLALVLWLVIGGIFFPREPLRVVPVTQATIISAAEFAAMTASPNPPSAGPRGLDGRAHLEHGQVHGHHQPADEHPQNRHDDGFEQAG
ncbi:MAG: hypothetical protein ACO3XL_12655, partial [Gemmobacter sp.]